MSNTQQPTYKQEFTIQEALDCSYERIYLPILSYLYKKARGWAFIGDKCGLQMEEIPAELYTRVVEVFRRREDKDKVITAAYVIACAYNQLRSCYQSAVHMNTARNAVRQGTISTSISLESGMVEVRNGRGYNVLEGALARDETRGIREVDIREYIETRVDQCIASEKWRRALKEWLLTDKTQEEIGRRLGVTRQAFTGYVGILRKHILEKDGRDVLKR